MIVDHPTIRYDDRWGSEPAKVVECDFCGKRAGTGRDPGEAANMAYKVGFKTMRDPKDATGPRLWTCECQ